MNTVKNKRDMICDNIFKNSLFCYMSIKISKPRSFRVAILSAIAIAFAGFGMMLNFWIFDEKNPNIYGFFHYKAATFGDGFFIPCIVGGALYFLKSIQVKENKKVKTIAINMGVLFVLIGALIQFSWLKNPNIVLNWTIPRPFHFTIAGWYHAVFFSLCLGLVVFLCVSVYLGLLNYKKNKEMSVDCKLSFIIFWLGCSGYVFMHVLDDYAHVFKMPYLLLIPLLLLLIINLIWLINTKVWKLSLIASGLAFFLALLISHCHM